MGKKEIQPERTEKSKELQPQPKTAKRKRTKGEPNLSRKTLE